MAKKSNITGNRGEWSEQYVMYFLLKSRILKGSDRRLEPTQVNMPLIKVIREESGSVMEYLPGKMIKIYRDGRFVKEISELEFEQNADYLKNAICNHKGSARAFAIEVTEEFMNKIGCHKLKSDSDSKRDITLQFHDIMTNSTPIEGFSIKSYLGAEPSLINPSNATKFRYKVVGCNEAVKTAVNSIQKDYIGMVQKIFSSNCRLEFVNTVSEQFRKNLSMIDDNIVEILQRMVIHCFAGQAISVKQMVEYFEVTDPLHKGIPNYYHYKIKQLLSASALGMVPDSPWIGDEDANGGFIVVKSEGDVVCFFIYDRKELYEYLIDYTRLDRPSTHKYDDYMQIVEEDGTYYLDLCLQIRFVDPKHTFTKLKYWEQIKP